MPICAACGAALATEQAASREERKVVTVFFADLVGFTGRAVQLDPYIRESERLFAASA